MHRGSIAAGGRFSNGACFDSRGKDSTMLMCAHSIRSEKNRAMLRCSRESSRLESSGPTMSCQFKICCVCVCVLKQVCDDLAFSALRSGDTKNVLASSCRYCRAVQTCNSKGSRAAVHVRTQRSALRVTSKNVRCESWSLRFQDFGDHGFADLHPRGAPFT